MQIEQKAVKITILKVVKDENSNYIILSNNEEENKDIFPRQTYIFSFIKLCYF